MTCRLCIQCKILLHLLQILYRMSFMTFSTWTVSTVDCVMKSFPSISSFCWYQNIVDGVPIRPDVGTVSARHRLSVSSYSPGSTWHLCRQRRSPLSVRWQCFQLIWNIWTVFLCNRHHCHNQTLFTETLVISWCLQLLMKLQAKLDSRCVKQTRGIGRNLVLRLM